MERLSPGDLTVLASDRGQVPMHVAAVLALAPGAGLTAAGLGAVLPERLSLAPRLRQRLVRPGGWSGRPYWEDDPDFDLSDHVASRRVRNRQELLDLAAELVCARMDHGRPLWSICAVDTGPGQGDAVVVVMHQVLADGLGGLAVLGALADPAPKAVPAPVPRPTVTTGGQGSALAAVRRGVAGLRELGLGERPRMAPPTSLNRPTGHRRRLACTGAPLAAVRAVGHRAGGTVNDVVVSAVVGALLELLDHRGEHPDALVVSVPVSARRQPTPDALGNQVGVRPIRVPAVPDDQERLRAVIALRRKAGAKAPASSAAPLGVAFRALGRLGLFQWFVDHQRLVHTFVTNVRGPAQPLRLAGREITGITPVAVNPGNVTVSFDVLSYAGWLGVTVVADPDQVPELDLLTRSVGKHLGASGTTIG